MRLLVLLTGFDAAPCWVKDTECPNERVIEGRQQVVSPELERDPASLPLPVGGNDPCRPVRRREVDRLRAWWLAGAVIVPMKGHPHGFAQPLLPCLMCGYINPVTCRIIREVAVIGMSKRSTPYPQSPYWAQAAENVSPRSVENSTPIVARCQTCPWFCRERGLARSAESLDSNEHRPPLAQTVLQLGN